MEEAPEAYEVDERGIAVLVRPATSQSASELEALLRGARACPMDAISVFDDAGRRIHP